MDLGPTLYDTSEGRERRGQELLGVYITGTVWLILQESVPTTIETNFYYKRHDTQQPTSYGLRPMTRCDYGKEKEQEKATYMQDVTSCREDRTHQHR